jgi:integrase
VRHKDDGRPRAISTIQRRKAAISEAHKLQGETNPCLDPLVKQVTKGLRRQLGVAPTNRKTGLSTADVRAIVGGLDEARLINFRDKAVLLLGFATAMRRSELVALTVADVEDHLEGLLVHRRTSKTDQEGADHQIEVAYGEHLDTCPVRAYRAWLDETGIDHGPVFRAVTDTVTSLPPRSAIGLSPTSSRNTPNGSAATPATTGHTSTKGLRPYIEDAEIFTDPPSRYLGL